MIFNQFMLSSFSTPVGPELKLSIETSMLHARAELGFCSLRQLYVGTKRK